MKSRAEHLAWCKQRALEYVEREELVNAMASMISDLRKHPETADHVGGQIGAIQLIAGTLSTKEELRKFIDGFN